MNEYCAQQLRGWHPSEPAVAFRGVHRSIGGETREAREAS